MPTYDYLCKACGHALEIFQSMSEGAKRKCPECGKLKLERQIGAGAGFLFKGSGYYLTDYRSDSYKQAAEKDKSASTSSSDSSSSSEKKSEKKSDSAKSSSKKKSSDK